MGIMSEEIKAPEAANPATTATKPKQYLLMVDELNAALLGRVFPAIQMVQVEGINMQNNESHMALVTPMVKPPIQAAEAPKVD
jgi:hypothetical protein